jgi:hypothetical protein
MTSRPDSNQTAAGPEPAAVFWAIMFARKLDTCVMTEAA